MDITSTLEPKSDQLDAVDLLSGPRIFTVKSVSKGSAEQPVDVHLVEFPRPWRPSKGMRRVLAACWGVDASAWAGRRVELYCDSNVRFGGEIVSGTRIAKLSDIKGEQRVPMIVSRGKSAVFTVQPLAASKVAAPASEASEPEQSELLIAAINRQVKDMQASGSSSFLTTWAQAQGVNPSSKALAEKFGERARDLRALMAELPTDVQP